jgi:hypothetical protein
MGLLKYSNNEEKLQVWMIVERLHDPEESVFRLLNKLIKKGKADDRIESRMKLLVCPKLHSELTFEEFKELFILIFAKMNELSPKTPTFISKLSSTLKTFMESAMKTVEQMTEKARRKARVFPVSQKDLE